MYTEDALTKRQAMTHFYVTLSPYFFKHIFPKVEEVKKYVHNSFFYTEIYFVMIKKEHFSIYIFLEKNFPL